jgi:hypothetical protein
VTKLKGEGRMKKDEEKIDSLHPLPSPPPVFARAWIHERACVANSNLNLAPFGASDALPGLQGWQMRAARAVCLLVQRKQTAVDRDAFKVNRIAAHRVISTCVVKGNAFGVGVQHQRLVVIAEIIARTRDADDFARRDGETNQRDRGADAWKAWTVAVPIPVVHLIRRDEDRRALVDKERVQLRRACILRTIDIHQAERAIAWRKPALGKTQFDQRGAVVGGRGID